MNKGPNIIQRDTGPELLRIVSMVLIILHHISVHGNIEYLNPDCFNNSVLSAIAMGGKVGVNVFVIITGFYSINSSVKVKKTLMLVSETVFYSVFLYIFSVIVGAQELSSSNFISSLLPFFSNSGNWFIVTYIILYLLIPFINEGIKHLNRLQHLILIYSFVFLWVIIPSVLDPMVSIQLRNYEVTSIGWFILLYIIGAYLNQYPVALMQKRKQTFFILLLFSISSVYCKLLFEKIYFDDSKLIGRLTNIFYSTISNCSSYGFASLIIAVLLFIFFVQVRIKPSKLLYMISGATFGVYLIHDSGWLRRYFWDSICRINRIAESKFFIVLVFVYAIAILCACSFIDIIRKYCLEKPIFDSRFYESFEKGIINRVSNCIKVQNPNNGT